MQFQVLRINACTCQKLAGQVSAVLYILDHGVPVGHGNFGSLIHLYGLHYLKKRSYLKKNKHWQLNRYSKSIVVEKSGQKVPNILWRNQKPIIITKYRFERTNNVWVFLLTFSFFIQNLASLITCFANYCNKSCGVSTSGIQKYFPNWWEKSKVHILWDLCRHFSMC